MEGVGDSQASAARGGEQKPRGGKGVKTPLWCCPTCKWHLYVPAPCPLCTGAASLPCDLSEDEKRPPWRPAQAPAHENAGGDTHEDGDAEDEGSRSSDEEAESVNEEEAESEEDEELKKMMGGGWHPAPVASRQQEKREAKVWNVGTLNQKKGALPPKPAGATRFVCISDTHNKHRQLELPAGDVLIHSGDFSLSCKEKELVDFIEWIDGLPYAHKIVVAGNHDVAMHSEFYERHHWRFHTEKIEQHRELKQRLSSVCTYLESGECEINGLRIWGSPWVPYYHDWAFMLPDEQALKAEWALVPAGVDVLITHGPPHKARDQTYHGANAGCTQLAEAVYSRIKPAVHVFGHIHSGYGVLKQRGTTFINTAIVNTRYKVANAPVVFDI